MVLLTESASFLAFAPLTSGVTAVAGKLKRATVKRPREGRPSQFPRAVHPSVLVEGFDVAVSEVSGGCPVGRERSGKRDHRGETDRATNDRGVPL